MDAPKTRPVRLITLGDHHWHAAASPQSNDIGLGHKGHDDVGVKLFHQSAQPQYACDIPADPGPEPPPGSGSRKSTNSNGILQLEKGFVARVTKSNQGDIMSLANPVIGQESCNAFRTSWT